MTILSRQTRIRALRLKELEQCAERLGLRKLSSLRKAEKQQRLISLVEEIEEMYVEPDRHRSCTPGLYDPYHP